MTNFTRSQAFDPQQAAPTAPAAPATPTFTDPSAASLEEELGKINQEIYQRNAELALRNRTLSVLSKIYKIINTSLGVEETAQRLIDAVVTELGFLKSSIALIDPTTHELKMIAASSTTGGQDKATADAHESLKKFSVPLTQVENLCVKSINQRTRRITNSLYDVLMPTLDEATCAGIQETFAIKTVIVDPIEFAGDVLGVLIIGIGKHIGFLSKAEFETIKGIIDVMGIAIERAQIYRDLKDANVRLQELDKLKDEFVSVASHELRTPMTAIKSYLWMVLEGKGGPLQEKQQFYLSRAYISTTRLIKLVNEMLNVSRIESGRVTITLSKVNMQTLTDEVFSEITPRAHELGLNLVLKKAENLPDAIADSDKIKEVLINLVGNSLKFTSKGGFITVSFEAKDGYVVTHVTDTGVGITQEDMPKLFKKFGMLHGSYVVNQQISQGTGLGLYISKTIVELHGGRIGVYSKGRGQGTMFSFALKAYNDNDFKTMEAKFKGKGEIGIIHTTV